MSFKITAGSDLWESCGTFTLDLGDIAVGYVGVPTCLAVDYF
jgi:hypothetical protein